MSREFVHRERAARDRLEHGFHVPLRRPTGVADRVIDPFLLVCGVAAAWSERVRDGEFQLLLEERRARNGHARDAHEHDAPFLAADIGRELDGRVARRGRGDHRGVDAVAAAHREGAGADVRVARRGLDSQRLRELETVHIEVGAEHGNPLRFEKARSNLADQPETDHEHARAEHRIREADALERNRADGGVGRLLEGNVLGNLRAEVLADDDDAGVRAGGSHAVSSGERGYAVADGEHDAGRGVSERHRIVEPRAHLRGGGHEAFAPDLLQHAADVVGPLARLGEQALARELDDIALGAGRDERRDVRDQHAVRLDERVGQIANRGDARPDVLNDLFHEMRYRLTDCHHRGRLRVAACASGVRSVEE